LLVPIQTRRERTVLKTLSQELSRRFGAD
jgi:hypothetical protein